MSYTNGKLELVYSPYAWMKLWWLLQSSETEVGGWGIARDPEKLLYIDDILVPKQKCTSAYCDFDMDDCATRFYDLVVEEGLDPKQFSGIWIHTHPGSSPNPSGVDERTFAERQGEWAIMAIVAKEGQTFARLKVRTTLCALTHDMTVKVDWPKYKQDVEKILTPETLAIWRGDLDRVETGYYNNVSSGYSHTPYTGTGGSYDPDRWKRTGSTHWSQDEKGAWIDKSTAGREVAVKKPEVVTTDSKSRADDDYDPKAFTRDYDQRMAEHYRRKSTEQQQERQEMEEEWHRAEASALGFSLEEYRESIGWQASPKAQEPDDEDSKDKETGEYDPNSIGFHVT